MSQGAQPQRSIGGRPSGMSWPVVLLLLLTVVLIMRVTERGGLSVLYREAAPRPVTPRGDLAEDEKTTIEVFQRVSPSVVHITAVDQIYNNLTRDATEVPAGVGSGFIWSEDGYIVTNHHVISKAEGVMVTFADGTAMKGRVVGHAPDQDLAVIKVEAPPDTLHPITIGSSSDLVVGQKVFVIGNPFGLDHTLTTGTISGLGRSIRTESKRLIPDIIQTDAAINPGNSGGPLLDSAGRLIGVTTAIFSPSGASAGVGFSVPVDIVNRVVPQLIQYGKVERPGLGVRLVADDLTHRWGFQGVLILPDDDNSLETQTGIHPTYQDPETGRLVLGDLIVAIDGQEVRRLLDLIDILTTKKVGETVQVTVIRDGKKINLPIQLREI